MIFKSNNVESLDSILGVFNNTLDKLISFISRKKELNQEIDAKVTALNTESRINTSEIEKAEYTVGELKKLLGK